MTPDEMLAFGRVLAEGSDIRPQVCLARYLGYTVDDDCLWARKGGRAVAEWWSGRRAPNVQVVQLIRLAQKHPHIMQTAKEIAQSGVNQES